MLPDHHKKTASKDCRKRVDALVELITSIYGSEKLVLKAGKLDALTLIRSRSLSRRLLGLQRIILENPALQDPPPGAAIPEVLEELEGVLADQLARRSLEESIEQKVRDRVEERHEEYLQEIKRHLLKELGGAENPQTLKKYAQLETKYAHELSRSALELLRPGSLNEIVGQEKAIKALISKLSSPHPSHVILYGPPGVGKTTAARLVLEEVKQIPHTPFAENAPFVEVDGTTLRWDPRETTNPLIGSVHDPIYQGARRDLAESGVPEPKPGLVTDAHGGILFIDEIGEMDLHLQSKLLKVLEDKKAHFESAYYDPADPHVPRYIKLLFEQGAPADFVLVGATTRLPENISPALRSRCTAVYFEPLTPGKIVDIVQAAAAKLKIKIDPGVAELISNYTNEGRQAVNILVDAYGMALYEQRKNGRKQLRISARLAREVVQNSRLMQLNHERSKEKEAVGRVSALGVYGFNGSVIEIEALAFLCATPGKGHLRFNETAGSMARDSVFVAASMIRQLTGLDLHDFDLHLNVIGGGNIDGPSAGAAIFIALLSAIKGLPVRQDCAVTGEISLQGDLKAVGGMTEKVYGARLGGFKKVIIPEANQSNLALGFPDMKIIPVRGVHEMLPHFFKSDALRKILYKEGA